MFAIKSATVVLSDASLADIELNENRLTMVRGKFNNASYNQRKTASLHSMSEQTRINYEIYDSAPREEALMFLQKPHSLPLLTTSLDTLSLSFEVPPAGPDSHLNNSSKYVAATTIFDIQTVSFTKATSGWSLLFASAFRDRLADDPP
jgi:hypothetical protein